MKAPVQFAPCSNTCNPKVAITDGQGDVIAFAASSTMEVAEQNASYIADALNHYLAVHPYAQTEVSDITFHP